MHQLAIDMNTDNAFSNAVVSLSTSRCVGTFLKTFELFLFCFRNIFAIYTVE
jgi:Na+/H+ antiporter NhaA